MKEFLFWWEGIWNNSICLCWFLVCISPLCRVYTCWEHTRIISCSLYLNFSFPIETKTTKSSQIIPNHPKSSQIIHSSVYESINARFEFVSVGFPGQRRWWSRDGVAGRSAINLIYWFRFFRWRFSAARPARYINIDIFIYLYIYVCGDWIDDWRSLDEVSEFLEVSWLGTNICFHEILTWTGIKSFYPPPPPPHPPHPPHPAPG